MFAVIRTGGKQYKVAEGDRLKVEKLEGNAGDTVEFTDVLMLGGDETQVGNPTLPQAKVTARIEQQDKDKKIIVSTYKRRQDYQRRQGHRQAITRLRITGIEG